MNRLNRILPIIRQLMRVSRGIGIPPWRAVPRFCTLVGPRKFSLAEVWSLALLDPALTSDRLAAYFSKEAAWPLYQHCNRAGELELLNNKLLFHTACDRLGLPTLGCIRALEPDEISKLRADLQTSNSAKLKEQLTELPEKFVVKPVEGYHGDGVTFFQKKAGQLFLLSGRPVDFQGFVEHLEMTSRVKSVGGGDQDQSVMIQKMGRAHSSLARLSGKNVMQSVRICTYLDEGGKSELLFGFLKVIAGDSPIDNFQGGRTGNIIADIEQSSGRIIRAIRFDSALGASRPIQCHPLTREALPGFKVPDWLSACDLALCAAQNFSQTRAVGWDIGLTDSGPVLLEGNGTWDPVSPFYRPLPLPNHP